MPTLPALSIRSRSVPPVVTDSWSAPGENRPVFRSPVIVTEGAAAVPATTFTCPVNVGAAVSALSVFRLVKLASTSAWVRGVPLPALVTIVLMVQTPDGILRGWY